jgi:hypothetical protein
MRCLHASPQVLQCDAQYPGGLAAYVGKARRLLRESAEGVNPFDGYTPEVSGTITSIVVKW